MDSRERRNGRLIALFFLGVLLFSPLPMRIFDAGADATLAGIPLLMIYVFAAWGLLIALLTLATQGLEEIADESAEPGENQTGPWPPTV